MLDIWKKRSGSINPKHETINICQHKWSEPRIRQRRHAYAEKFPICLNCGLSYLMYEYLTVQSENTKSNLVSRLKELLSHDV